MSRKAVLAAASLAVLLASCQMAPPRLTLPQPLNVPSPQQGKSGLTIKPQGSVQTTTRVEPTPPMPHQGKRLSGLGLKQIEPPLAGAPIKVALENMPLPAFVNEVFGHLLDISYFIDPSLANKTDLVTLRITDPQPRKVFYRTVLDVLRRYGIAAVWDGHTLNIVLATDASASTPPLLISGRALPQVPESHRPIFQLVQLHNVSNGDVTRWLRTAYGDNKELKIDEDIRRNAVVLSGPPVLVRQAVQAIKVLDQPYLRGSFSARIEPAFIAADDLAKKLVEALRAQGYAADSQISPGTSIVVLPVQSTNTLLVFAPDRSVLNHVIDWARTIDQPNPSSSKDSLFYYPVQNTKASEIAAVINGSPQSSGSNDLTMGSTKIPNRTGSGMGSGSTGLQSNTSSNSNKQTSASNMAGGALSDKGVLTVDEPRNALIFRGDPTEWKRLLPLIKQMDKAARQVMIQVTIAEVTLDNSTDIGLNWLAYDRHGRFHGTWQSGTLTPSTGTASAGLTYLVDVAGVNRAMLTAIAQDQRVKVLSTPRILVKSGDEASIDVGTEIPTLSAQTTSNQLTGGSSNLLQSIQYRNTGIILDVKPTVYSDNRIDLDISQEVSDAQSATTGGLNSPSIFKRSIKTSLTLMDGGSVVLGGLVSDKETTGNSGVPFLKDIPLIGNLFKTRTKSKTRTELLVIIVPYIVDTDQRSREVTQAVLDSMKSIDSQTFLKPKPKYERKQRN